MKVVEKQLKELRMYENNPRNNDQAVEEVAKSIQEFGFKVPMVIDTNNVIVCGHTRYKACLKLGINSVPCVVADDLSPDQIKAFRLVENKTNEIASWDFDKLNEELNLIQMDMSEFEFDVPDFSNMTYEDDYEEEQDVKAKTKQGNIFRLGRHRLMCGDSTSENDVKKLVGNVKPKLFLTDPPYNVDYDGLGTRANILNDSFATDEECGEKLWLPAFTNAYKVCDDVCSVYCFMPQGSTHMMMMMMMMKAGWQVKHELIWRKQSIVLNRADYNYQHEPILFGWKNKHIFYGKGQYSTTSVWDFDRPTKSKEHPTMKPIPLLTEVLLNSSKKNDDVLDLFGGSGSTLIACEQSERNCLMMELDPHYCDVIIDRWERQTGEKAELINEEGK